MSESIEKGWHLFGVTPQYDVVGVNTVSSDWADRHEGEKLTAKNTPWATQGSELKKLKVEVGHSPFSKEIYTAKKV
jgi:hypothetical protein